MLKDWLYKLDSNGCMRVWRLEVEGAQYRTISGLKLGQKVTSGWVTAKANTLRDAVQQAAFEVDAAYKYKLKTDYFSTEEEASKGPRHSEPMLAKGHDKAGKRVADVTLWILQPKLDGIRCVAKADGCFSRSGERFLTTGLIEAALEPLFRADPDLVLDGELYNHDYHDRFNELSGLIRKGMNAKTPPTAEEIAQAQSVMQYHVYDVASHPGAQRHRLEALAELDLESPLLRMVTSVFPSGEASEQNWYERFVEAGYEGMMYRHRDGLYQYGKRPWDLLKRKEFETAEFRLKRVEEGEGDWKGKAKRLIFEWTDGREFGSGLRGSQEFARKLFEDFALGECEFESATVRFMPPPQGALPRVAVAIDFHGPGGRRD